MNDIAFLDIDNRGVVMTLFSWGFYLFGSVLLSRGSILLFSRKIKFSEKKWGLRPKSPIEATGLVKDLGDTMIQSANQTNKP